LVELGSGLSAKTRLLIDAMRRAGTFHRFVPVDVDSAVLTVAVEQLRRAYPGLRVDPVVGDFEDDLQLPQDGIRTVAFLGSTIGNLAPAARARFLRSLRGALRSLARGCGRGG
jgi:L-histidine N-alpha-methyltransferase